MSDFVTKYGVGGSITRRVSCWYRVKRQYEEEWVMDRTGKIVKGGLKE